MSREYFPSEKFPHQRTFREAPNFRNLNDKNDANSSPLDSLDIYWKTVIMSKITVGMFTPQTYPFDTHSEQMLTFLRHQPECVLTSNPSSNTPSRPRRETSSRPSSSKSASRTMILNVTSVSLEPSVSQLFHDQT